LPKKNRNWQLGGAAKWINAAPAHKEAIGGVALEREVSGKISLSSDFFITLLITHHQHAVIPTQEQRRR